VPRIGVLITYEEVYGKRGSLDDLHALLRPLSFYSVIVSLGKINAVMRTWLNEPDIETDKEICKLLFGAEATRVERVRERYPAGVAVTRMTVLYVCRQATLSCASDGQSIDSPEDLLAIGQCCLIANDLSLTVRFAPSSPVRDKAAALIPFSSYLGREDYANEIARTQIILMETATSHKAAASPDFVDLAELFRQTTGISITDFASLVFGLLTRYLGLTLRDLFGNPDSYFVPPTFFGRTAVDHATLDRFLDLICIDLEALRERLTRGASRPPTDMLVFQASPCVRNEHGSLFCIDPIALIEKASTGVYWILNSTPYAADNRLFRFWGLLFEEYVNGLLMGAHNPELGQFVPNPLFADGEEVSDACLLEGLDLLLLEHKASILTSKAKYSGDLTEFEADVVRKLVGTDVERKGVRQLAHSIERILRGDHIPSLPNLRQSRIFPALVVQDRALTSFYMNTYLNEFFPRDGLRKINRTVITPVFVLTVGDIEDLCCYLHSYKISDLLDEHYSQNKKLVSGFRGTEHPMLQGAVPRSTPVRERFRAFSEEMMSRFFPEEGKPATGVPRPT